MKVFTCVNDFDGFWPVGTSALIIADDAEHAKVLLEAELDKIRLGQIVPYESIKEVSLDEPKAIILNDGDY